jgi:hypothetical protein
MKKVSKWMITLIVSTVTSGAIGAAEGTISELDPQAKNGTFVVGGERISEYKLSSVPKELSNLPTVYMPRGKITKPGTEFSFSISQPAIVYICVHARGKVTAPQGWEETNLLSFWNSGSNKFADKIYRKYFSAGKVKIPVHKGIDGGVYGIPSLAVVDFNVNTSSSGTGIVKTLNNGCRAGKINLDSPRASGCKYLFINIPVELEEGICIYAPRANSHQEGMPYSFEIDTPADVYILVQDRGTPTIPEQWNKTNLKTAWKAGRTKYTDSIYKKEYPAGKIEIPANDGKDENGNYGLPHAVVIKAKK